VGADPIGPPASIDGRYRETYERAAASFVNGGNAGLSAERAAGTMVRIMESKRPRVRYYLSAHPLLDRLEASIPAPVMDRLISWRFGLA
jgi:hypothetical protein